MKTSRIRIVTLLLIQIICSTVLAQYEKNTMTLKREGEQLCAIENGKTYNIDTKTVLARLKLRTTKMPKDIKQKKCNSLGIIEIMVPDSILVEDYVSILKETGIFERIEYNHYYKPFLEVNDTYISDQWYINTINASSVWNLTTGNHSVKVAVIDNGVDAIHQDLNYGNDSYTNLNTADGYDYVSNTNNPIVGGIHGTMVAGIIGAKTNNSFGIAGISGGNSSSGIQLVPYRTNYLASQIVNAIADAITKGVKVINLSLGGTYNYYVDQAIESAYSNGISVICASGNDNVSSLPYPASNQHTIAVGASDNSNQRASFSNYGTGLDLVAPGTNIKSTSINNNYYTDDGTSFSAPQVSGTIALMLSVNPTLTPDTIRNILRSTCTKLSGYTYTSGWNNETGYGLLNTYAAVSAVIPKIYGRDFFLYTSDYNVSSSPLNDISNWDVSWSADFQINGVYTTLQVDSLNHFHCTVIKDSIAPINHNIYATLYYNGDSITTIKKKIYGHMKKGNAFYLLKRYPQGNIIDAALLKPNNTINITTGQFYTINSVNIGGMNVEEFTVYPNNLSRYMGKEDDNIRIKIDSNGSVIYRVWGYDESGTLEDFRFTIHANSSTTYMSVSKSDNIFTVELKESEVEKSDNIENVTVINDDMEWTIGVTNALKGKQILAKKVKGKSTSFDTSGWPQGLYVIRVIVNGETLTEKIYIINK